jgi:hypothetical protein
MFYIYYIFREGIVPVRQLLHFISKMSTSKQPAEKRRRTDNDSDEGIHNFFLKKNKIFYLINFILLFAKYLMINMRKPFQSY